MYALLLKLRAQSAAHDACLAAYTWMMGCTKQNFPQTTSYLYNSSLSPLLIATKMYGAALGITCFHVLA